MFILATRISQGQFGEVLGLARGRNRHHPRHRLRHEQTHRGGSGTARHREECYKVSARTDIIHYANWAPEFSKPFSKKTARSTAPGTLKPPIPSTCFRPWSGHFKG